MKTLKDIPIPTPYINCIEVSRIKGLTVVLFSPKATDTFSQSVCCGKIYPRLRVNISLDTRRLVAGYLYNIFTDHIETKLEAFCNYIAG